jgi:peroxiredoxin Q/BCP
MAEGKLDTGCKRTMLKTTKSMVGKAAPNFALRDQAGNLVKLRNFRGKKVLLYFYVRDDTPGCTKEACSFRDGMAELRRKNVMVVGVSPDPADAHKRFASKYALTFPLLIDQRAQLAKKFGVWGKKNMYGRTFYGIIRSTFIIDERGKVSKEYRRVKVDGHLDQVLRDLE